LFTVSSDDYSFFKSANDQIFAISWHPTIKNLIVVYGRGHFSFWQFDAHNKALTKNLAIFEGRDKPKTLLSMCFSETGDVITGDSNGTLSLWDPTTFKTRKQAHGVHPGGVFALCVSRKGTLLSAGKDRTVAEWETTDLIRRRRPVELPDDAGTPKVILNLEVNQIVVGTTRNTLYLGDFEASFEEIVDGDSEDVTCCVAVQSHLFITASADGGLRQYDSSTKKRDWRKNYGDGITCLSVDQPGALLALGFSGGSWSVVDLSTKETVFEQKESTQPITTVRFAPNSSLLFVGTKVFHFDYFRMLRRESVSFYRCDERRRKRSATTGELVDHASVRDVEWASCNCRISYETGCLAHSVEGSLEAASL
ncbi:WD domain, G-beta repeat protein, partial [Cooperia oncophora]